VPKEAPVVGLEARDEPRVILPFRNLPAKPTVRYTRRSTDDAKVSVVAFHDNQKEFIGHLDVRNIVANPNAALAAGHLTP